MRPLDKPPIYGFSTAKLEFIFQLAVTCHIVTVVALRLSHSNLNFPSTTHLLSSVFSYFRLPLSRPLPFLTLSLYFHHGQCTDYKEAHQAFQAPPVRPIQGREGGVAEAEGYR
ncbi:hypothetical protein A0H81_00755 [Grifola frondosa]|uniref:Uncharacterized protein n=1 Tax=Grifola frondosa TaxID=5627 RepID=A0A1C7MR61_GRIFR|nr:hypothetical protein A0H81_00755 [Grifola frondosa]